jgi:hypothetical protein
MAQAFRVEGTRDQMLKAAANFERMARDARAREIADGLSHLGRLARSRPASAA